MTTQRAIKKNLEHLAIWLMKYMEYGTEFTYYAGTNSFDEDFIKVGEMQIYYFEDGEFAVKWYNTILAQYRTENLKWDELIEVLQKT